MIFIDLSSKEEEDDDNDCLIISPCVFACNTKQYKEMASNQAVSRNTRSKSKAGMMKDDEVALISTADTASHNKRRKAEKKKEDKLAVIPAATAAAAPKKTQVAEKKKKSPITVNKKIPQANVICMTPKGTIKFNMHTSLADKRIILYGLPGFLYTTPRPFTLTELKDRMTRWKPFKENRILKPALDFIKQTEVLMGKGVDEIVFFTVNSNVLLCALQTPAIIGKYEYVKFICLLNYLHALGIEMDIPLEGLGQLSRRFILLLDNLKVKFANIESSDENFNIPSNEEIIKAFDQ